MEPKYWQDKFFEEATGALHEVPRDVPSSSVSKVDFQRNIAQLLGDTIETMDMMIAYSRTLKPKFEAMEQAGIEWQELAGVRTSLDTMQRLGEARSKAYPMHQLINSMRTPNVAFRTAMKNADAIYKNAENLCGDVLTLHHALEALNQRILLDTGKLSGRQKDTVDKYVARMAKNEMAPHTEAQTLAAAVLMASHDMRALHKIGQEQENKR